MGNTERWRKAIIRPDAEPRWTIVGRTMLASGPWLFPEGEIEVVPAEQLAGAVADWNRAYWCWVHTGDGGDMARLAGEDTWGEHPDPPGGQ